jgi:protein O-GlcNAc transferase
MQGKMDDGIVSYQNAISIKPDDSKAHYNIGVILQGKEKFAEAVAKYYEVISIKPDHEDSYYSIGVIFQKQGKTNEASASYQKAIAINPNYEKAYYNFGVILQEQGCAEDAILNFKKTVAIKPDFASAYYNIGVILQGEGKHDEAIACYQKAISINSDYVDALHNLAIIKKEEGKLEEAIAGFRKVIALKPDAVISHNHLIFCIDVFSAINSDLFEVERKNWAKTHSDPLQGHPTPFSNTPDPTRMLRIGYVGADFFRHSAAYIFGPALLHHDAEKFQIFCYAGNTHADDLTEQFKKKSTRWLSTSNMDDATLAQEILNDGIDILVDLAGHTTGNRLLTFARKPAPIQITAWGYPHGTQMAAMDYLFADPIFIPQSERKKYTEHIIDLPCVIHSYIDIAFPDVKEPPICQNGYITFGAFNRIEKYNNEVYALWAEILRNIPTAKLLIKTGKLDSPNYIQEVESIFLKHGIHQKRLILSIGSTSKLEHQKAHNQVDIMLDPFPHSGGMTTMESLRMGVPVLTCEKKTRCPTSASVLHVLGLDEWRVTDEMEYVEKAEKFAMDIPNLKKLRQELRSRFDQSFLGNSQKYVSEVEAIYRQLWHRWSEGKK